MNSFSKSARPGGIRERGVQLHILMNYPDKDTNSETNKAYLRRRKQLFQIAEKAGIDFKQEWHKYTDKQRLEAIQAICDATQYQSIKIN
jgi:hypothetical protein